MGPPGGQGWLPGWCLLPVTAGEEGQTDPGDGLSDPHHAGTCEVTGVTGKAGKPYSLPRRACHFVLK